MRREPLFLCVQDSQGGLATFFGQEEVADRFGVFERLDGVGAGDLGQVGELAGSGEDAGTRGGWVFGRVMEILAEVVVEVFASAGVGYDVTDSRHFLGGDVEVGGVLDGVWEHFEKAALTEALGEVAQDNVGAVHPDFEGRL